MHHARTACLSILLVVSVYLLYQLSTLSDRYRTVKTDLVTLSDVRYGLFNVDEWKAVAADIITAKVASLDLSDDNREALRRKIEVFLTSTINDLEERYYQEKSKSIEGWIRGSVASITGTFDQMKKDIPIFTNQIIAFIDEKENRAALRAYIIRQVNAYADNTFASVDYSPIDTILDQHGYDDVHEAKALLTQHATDTVDRMRRYQLAAGGTVILTCLLLLLGTSLRPIQTMLVVGIALVYLFGGLTLPMIEIDARIAELSFQLLGEQVAFEDQVLYYKSKSIFEVISLMLSQGQLEVVAVGLLIMAFSVLFPLSKLIATLVDTMTAGRYRSRLMNFILFQSGKWSMADVLVVAIFMAYIGFDGILSEQLGQLSSMDKTMQMITTNGSLLQLGFYAFLSYVLISLCMSQRIKTLYSR